MPHRSEEKVPRIPLRDRVLGFVREFVVGHGRGPTLREISAHLDHASHGAAARTVKALLDSGELIRGDAGLVAAGQSYGEPCLARLHRDGELGHSAWIPAPAPNLHAFHMGERSALVAIGDLVFFEASGKAYAGQVAATRLGKTLGVVKLSDNPTGDREGITRWGAGAGGRALEILGPVRFTQHAFTED